MNFNSDITQDELKKALRYDPDTGYFTWIGSTRAKTNGLRAGTPSTGGYVIISIDNRLYSAHRLAWFYVYGQWPKEFLGHIDKKRTNNRIANLREVNKSENMQNQTVYKFGTSAGLLGVCKRGYQFVATIKINKKSKHLGTFATEEEAHQAYLTAKQKYHTHGNDHAD